MQRVDNRALLLVIQNLQIFYCNRVNQFNFSAKFLGIFFYLYEIHSLLIYETLTFHTLYYFPYNVITYSDDIHGKSISGKPLFALEKSFPKFLKNCVKLP